MDAIYQGNWITYLGNNEGKVWEFKKSIEVDKKIKGAKLYSSAIGTYAAYINGQKTDVYHLAPGYTWYKKRVQYQVTDVSELLNIGKNEISIFVAYGFLCQINKHENPMTDHLPGLEPMNTAIIVAIEIEYEDGSIDVIYTDDSWVAYETMIRSSDMYNGEVVDYTFSETIKRDVRIIDSDKSILIPQEGEIVKTQEVLSVENVITTPCGETVLDFGQNMVGHFIVTFSGDSKEELTLECGEVLDKYGNFYNGNYRAAKARLNLICDGKKHTYESDFVFYGFRYVRVTKSSDSVSLDDIKGVVVHSDMARIGHFNCSNEELNMLYHNIIWGQKGNFVDLPTDCPQRDERLGWTGDAQVFSNCASMNYNTNKFFKKWLGDMRACQRESGVILKVVPSSWATPSAAWSDACVIIPYNVYMQYGDKSVIYENYDMMKKWVEYIKNNYDEYTQTDSYHYGDWLALEKEDSYIGLTPRKFIANAFAAYSTYLFIECSKAIGKDYSTYTEFYNFVKGKIREEFADEETYLKYNPGTESSLDTQTYYVLRLYFKLYDSENERIELAKKLSEKIIKNNYKLQTGFVGTPYLLFALSQNGYVDLAYTLLLQREYPSWIYPITKGATTMWEHWDGIKENGEFWSDKMNSYNHYAYGSVGEWMYREMAGINAQASGYDEILFTPKTDDRIKNVFASIETGKGLVSSEWKIEDGKTKYVFVVPENVKATAIINDKEYKLLSGVTELCI